MDGTIFKIQRFCTEDGPGIRTTVFFKGCPLSCRWCHNPESQSFKSQLMYNGELCVNCGRCIERCPKGCHSFEKFSHSFKSENCISCGKCIVVGCNALSVSGYKISAQKVLDEVLKDKLFYESSSGGLTLSGGEPFAQYDFAKELLQKAKENNIHTCVETCGYLREDELKAIIPLVDLFLIDFKETDSQKHKEFTGVENETIIRNIKSIDDNGGKIVLRCPIIPGLNNTNFHLKGIANLASSLKNIERIELEPYHNFGVDKYKNLCMDYLCNDVGVPTEDEKQSWVKIIKAFTDVSVKYF